MTLEEQIRLLNHTYNTIKTIQNTLSSEGEIKYTSLEKIILEKLEKLIKQL